MDQQACKDTLGLCKDNVVLGTYETSAFILSLRDREEFSRLHTSGYHHIPHIGTYGQEYQLSLPMVLLSLPTSPRYLRKLPTDLLNALDLEHVFPSLTISNTPQAPTDQIVCTSHCTEKQHTISTGLHSVHLGPCSKVEDNLQLFAVAKELIENVLLSAVQRLKSGVNVSTGYNGFKSNHRELDTHSKSFDFLNVEKFPKEIAYTSSSSIHSARDMSYNHKSTSAANVSDEEVRIVAKKLVNKTLHMACKTIESLYRRSSIEYLIASTKRMKITRSPSPPTPLFDITEETEGNQVTPHSFEIPPVLIGKVEKSATLEVHKNKKLGSKRKRSGSHDVAMQDADNLEKKLSIEKENPDKQLYNATLVANRKFHNPHQNSLLSTSDARFVESRLASHMKILSIEADSCSGVDESYTILSSITIKENGEFADISHEHEQAHSHGHLTVQDCETKTFPSHQPGLNIVSSLDIDDDSHKYSNSDKLEFFPVGPNGSSDVSGNDMYNLDLFIIIHSYPHPSACQKFLCSNQDEINLVYHCWVYKDSPFDPAITLTNNVDMGVFEPCLVQPIHLELHDSGIPFLFLDKRTVCIHDRCFSPENAQLQLQSPPPAPPDQQHKHHFHSFFSAARHDCRRVVAYHVIPSSSTVEEQVRGSIQGCHSLDQLLVALERDFPEIGKKLSYLILPG